MFAELLHIPPTVLDEMTLDQIDEGVARIDALIAESQKNAG